MYNIYHEQFEGVIELPAAERGAKWAELGGMVSAAHGDFEFPTTESLAALGEEQLRALWAIASERQEGSYNMV